jgi:hypothetical protein
VLLDKAKEVVLFVIVSSGQVLSELRAGFKGIDKRNGFRFSFLVLVAVVASEDGTRKRLSQLPSTLENRTHLLFLIAFNVGFFPLNVFQNLPSGFLLLLTVRSVPSASTAILSVQHDTNDVLGPLHLPLELLVDLLSLPDNLGVYLELLFCVDSFLTGDEAAPLEQEVDALLDVSFFDDILVGDVDFECHLLKQYRQLLLGHGVEEVALAHHRESHVGQDLLPHLSIDSVDGTLELARGVR